MATNKNQHYVPRCYLKAFTLDAENKAINLFNIDSEKYISNAPVKNQCSGDYFYGNNPALEAALQATEGEYGRCAARIQTVGYRLNENDKIFLRRFWLLQYVRTDAASRRVAEMSNGIVETAGMGGTEFRMAMKDAIQMAMEIYVDEIRSVDDLKVCLLRNRTKIEFVSSDDPAILTNRWQLTTRKQAKRSLGLGSAGALALLPITPQIYMVAYDGDVYSIEHTNGWVNIAREQDVDTLNDHQFLNCRANIFLSEPSLFPRTLEQFQRVRPRRLTTRHRFNYAVLDRKENGVSTYRVVERAAILDEEAIIHAESLSPTPSGWPSVFRMRQSSSVYTNGTGLGYIRRAGAEMHGIHKFRRERAEL